MWNCSGVKYGFLHWATTRTAVFWRTSFLPVDPNLHIRSKVSREHRNPSIIIFRSLLMKDVKTFKLIFKISCQKLTRKKYDANRVDLCFINNNNAHIYGDLKRLCDFALRRFFPCGQSIKRCMCFAAIQSIVACGSCF